LIKEEIKDKMDVGETITYLDI